MRFVHFYFFLIFDYGCQFKKIFIFVGGLFATVDGDLIVFIHTFVRTSG